MTTVRKLTQYVPLTREEFRKRFFERFYDPAFDEREGRAGENLRARVGRLHQVPQVAAHRRPPGAEFSDPDLQAAGGMAADAQGDPRGREAPAAIPRRARAS